MVDTSRSPFNSEDHGMHMLLSYPRNLGSDHDCADLVPWLDFR